MMKLTDAGYRITLRLTPGTAQAVAVLLESGRCLSAAEALGLLVLWGCEAHAETLSRLAAAVRHRPDLELRKGGQDATIRVHPVEP